MSSLCIYDFYAAVQWKKGVTAIITLGSYTFLPLYGSMGNSPPPRLAHPSLPLPVLLVCLLEWKCGGFRMGFQLGGNMWLYVEASL